MENKNQSLFKQGDQIHLYDQDVSSEDNPVKKGYADLIQWVGDNVPENKEIIELGTGTGNTALKFPHWKKLHAVDFSAAMLKEAKKKLAGKKNVSFMQKDIVEFFYTFYGQVDVVVSTYTFHNIEQEDKHKLFKLIADNNVRVIIIGDLMFKDKEHEEEMRSKYPDLQENFDSSHFLKIDEDIKVLENLGYTVETKQFSDLSWGILGKK